VELFPDGPQSLDPGNLKTDLYKNVSRIQMLVINLVLKPPIYGAYTELYAGLSTDISLENSGAWGETHPFTRSALFLLL
jgi:retinol dehydrogenase 12